MATVTRTIAENQGESRQSWTLSLTGNNITVSGNSFTIAESFTAKTASGKGYGKVSVPIYFYLPNGTEVGGYSYFGRGDNGTLAAIKANTNYSLSQQNRQAITTSRVFNGNNATSKSVTLTAKGAVQLATAFDTDDWAHYGYSSYSNMSYSWGNLVTVTLNVPPTFDNDPMEYDTQGIFAKVTTASVDLSSITAYYGGYITQAKLTIGNQTAVLTGSATSALSRGTLAIKLDSVGTFTPVITVTDSRGQVKTVSLPSITVTAGDDTTFVSTQVSSDTPNFYATASTASVTISDIVVPYGGSAVSSKLVIGDQEVSGSGAGPLQIALDAVGTFIPVVSVTDSWGRTYSKDLDLITVREYLAPSITLDIDRAASDGTVDEESTTHILVTMQFTYTRDVATLLKPTLKVGLQEQNVTWYESWDSVNGVSDPISSWTNYHPASPSTIYALIPGTYSLANTYEIAVTAHDSRGKNSEEILQKVPIAFFTMDFLAGGHGVAFGKLATQLGLFECDLEAQFNQNVRAKNLLLNLDTTATSGTDKEIYDALMALGWDSDVIV